MPKPVKDKKRRRPAEVTVHSLRQQFNQVRRMFRAYEQNVQAAKKENERFGDEMNKLREEVRMVCDEVHALRQERIAGETQALSQEVQAGKATSEAQACEGYHAETQPSNEEVPTGDATREKSQALKK